MCRALHFSMWMPILMCLAIIKIHCLICNRNLVIENLLHCYIVFQEQLEIRGENNHNLMHHMGPVLMTSFYMDVEFVLMTGVSAWRKKIIPCTWCGALLMMETFAHSFSLCEVLHCHVDASINDRSFCIAVIKVCNRNLTIEAFNLL